MLKTSLTSFALACVTLLPACSAKETASEISDNDVFFADPTIINLNGQYYIAGTQESDPPGFTVLCSGDLLNWTPASSDTLPNLMPGDNVFGTKGFWAPQFVPTDSCVYMFYTANEQIALAKADSINGRYTWDGTAIDDSEKNIDPFLFTDTDGRHYLYHVRFDHGNWLWVGEFDFNTGHFVDGTLKPVFRNDQQ
ncbi:MAG: family 43 glycosylhydrolase, partial [Muribaculaceae bacterium]|nr:family 43 glycosylhydrolase [Muribaculaceae bacterium]